MTKKRNGIIRTYIDRADDGIENLLYPSFFLGQELAYDVFHSIWAATIASESPLINRNNQLAADKELGATLLKDGQYAMFHQYGGTACSPIILFGIFLPLSTCSDPAISKKITRLIERIGQTFGEPPNESLQQWKSELLDIGPLTIAHEKKSAREAFIRLSNLSELHPWLKTHFKYAVEFSGPDSTEIQAESDAIIPLSEIDRHKANPSSEIWKQYASALTRGFRERRISETASLPWDNIDQFASWLTRGSGLLQVNPRDIRASLIWENSD